MPSSQARRAASDPPRVAEVKPVAVVPCALDLPSDPRLRLDALRERIAGILTKAPPTTRPSSIRQMLGGASVAPSFGDLRAKDAAW
ncbi:MAG TPA: hypothetical protein VJT73_13885 [Polyangiaceae bacterium]|nr:hypothetical protein [Polyangiaceae bacterium]